MKARILAAAGALAMLAQPQAAMAQTCLTQPEISAMAIYAVPPVLAGVDAKCKGVLSPDGFLATQGVDTASRYAALAPQNWPVARGALMKLASAAPSRNPDQRQFLSTLAQLPDQAVRPVVDALIVQKLAESIRPASCARIEQGIALIAPLEPVQAGAIAAFVLSLMESEDLPVCDTQQP